MKFKNARQFDIMDCGAACLQMIAEHHGKYFSLDMLREKCFTTREGVSLLSVSGAAEEIGFKTLGCRLNIEKLVNKAPLPCILYWNQEHYIVLYKISKRKGKRIFYIADPSFGKIALKESEFIERWISTKSGEEEKGVVLLLEPTNSFFQNNTSSKPKESLALLISYFIKYKKYFLQLILGLFIGSIMQLFFPLLTQSIIDTGIKDKNIGFIYLVLLAQSVLIISRMSVEFIRRWLLLHISIRINLSLISDFFMKLMKLPMKFFDTKQTGDILQRIEDHQRVENLITSNSLETVFSLFSLIVFSGMLYMYSIKIFIIFFISSVIYVLWTLLFLKKRRELDYKFFSQRAKNQSNTYQLISGMQEIKLQNCEKRKRWEWEDIQADLFDLQVSLLKLQQIRDSGNIFINESKNMLITITSAALVINNQMTLGMMLATQYIIGQMNLPIEQLLRFVLNLQDSKISLERINEIHNKEDENIGKTSSLSEIKENVVKIENLTFQYEGPESKKVLNNISLSIPHGKVTAIVGASGSGKTTLLKLLLQYYQPIEGYIFIDKIDLKHIHTEVWRRNCGAVMQDGFIFSESIAKNVAISEDIIDKEKLEYACKTACIHDFILSLPLKYNTIIGQEGQNLSQGQKQRILIARAVYKNPNFLFFDEATNALDSKNERLIVENLNSFYFGKTVVIVAHRLSTVKNADQIIVLDNGEISEIGNHYSLTEKKGQYFDLVRNQLELGN
ncbi:MAG: peptidase domain-containing ABC transporter [Bacteroidota bacterium]